jgi:hypothetical protein
MKQKLSKQIESKQNRIKLCVAHIPYGIKSHHFIAAGRQHPTTTTRIFKSAKSRNSPESVVGGFFKRYQLINIFQPTFTTTNKH